MKRPQDKIPPRISLAPMSNKIGGEEIPEGLIEPYRREGAVDPNAAGAFWFNEKALAEVWRNYHFPDRSVMETPNGTNHFILVPSNEIGEWGSKSWELVSPPNNPRMGFRNEHFRLTPYRSRPMNATLRGDRDMSWDHENIDKAMYRLTRLAGCAKGDHNCSPTKNMSPEDKAKWEEENEAHKDQFKKKADGGISYILGDLLDMAVESVGGGDDAYVTPEMDRAAEKWNKAVEVNLLKWIKDNVDQFDLSARPFSKVYQGDPDDILYALWDYDGGAPYLYYMELDGAGVGTWDGGWDILFKDHGRKSLRELSKYMRRKLGRYYDNLKNAIYNAAEDSVPDDADEDDEYSNRYASRSSNRSSRRASRGYPSGLSNHEMDLWDELLLVAKNDPRAFDKNDPAGAVATAFRNYNDQRIYTLKYDFKKIKKALIKSIANNWAGLETYSKGPHGLKIDQMDLWDLLYVTAENDGNAYHKNDPASAVMSAFRAHLSTIEDKLYYDFKKIKKALISAVIEDWTTDEDSNRYANRRNG